MPMELARFVATADFDALTAAITPEERAVHRMQAECALGSMEGLASVVHEMPLDAEGLEVVAMVIGEGLTAGLYREVPAALLDYYRSAPTELVEEMLRLRTKSVLGPHPHAPAAELELGIALNIALCVAMYGPLREEHPAYAGLDRNIERLFERLPSLPEPPYFDR